MMMMMMMDTLSVVFCMSLTDFLLFHRWEGSRVRRGEPWFRQQLYNQQSGKPKNLRKTKITRTRVHSGSSDWRPVCCSVGSGWAAGAKAAQQGEPDRPKPEVTQQPELHGQSGQWQQQQQRGLGQQCTLASEWRKPRVALSVLRHLTFPHSTPDKKTCYEPSTHH